MWMTSMLLLVLMPLAVWLSVWLAVRAIRWVKKNQTQAAQLTAAGVEDDWWDDFRTWLGDKVDAIAESQPSSTHESSYSPDAASWDGGHSSAESCSSGDSGGVCGGD